MARLSVQVGKRLRRQWARRLGLSVPVQVRELVQQDRGAVFAAFAGAGAAPDDDELIRQARGELGIFVAWLGDRPAGIGFMQWDGPRNPALRQRWPGTPEIHRLHVLAACRSLGIGSCLLAKMEEAAAEQGLPCVGLGVHAGNRRAHRLYLDLGYQPDAQGFNDEYEQETRPGMLETVSVPSIFLVKAVTRPSGNR